MNNSPLREDQEQTFNILKDKYIRGEFLYLNELYSLQNTLMILYLRARQIRKSVKRKLARANFEYINHIDYSFHGFTQKMLLSCEVSSAQEELNELDDTIENNPKLLSRLQKDIEDRQTGKTKDQPYNDICL